MNKDQKRQQADRRNEMERDQKAKDQWGMWEQETSNNSVKATVNASPNKNEAIHDEKMDQPQREPELPFDKLAHGLGKSSVDSLEDTHISGGGSMPPGFNSGKGMGVLHPGNSQMQYENRRDQNRGNDRYGNQYWIFSVLRCRMKAYSSCLFLIEIIGRKIFSDIHVLIQLGHSCINQSLFIFIHITPMMYFFDS